MPKLSWTILATATLLGMATHASAKWHEVSSEHFIVYADDTEKDLQRFAEQLERYHQAMDYVTKGDYPKPSSSNRVTVYVVKNEAEVRKLAGADAPKWLGGFYVPRAGASIAIIPNVNSARGEINESMLTLLHEYAHHFTIGSTPVQLPRWVSEGSAEFYSSAKFMPDGGVSIGRPAVHRAMELHYAKDVRVSDLLDPDSYEKRKGKNSTYDAFYGKSWLLYHYLVFNKARAGQFTLYLNTINSGTPLVQAGREAFGDFDALEKELDAYQNARRMNVFVLPATRLPITPVTVRPLRDGEVAIMSVRIRSKRGVNKQSALPVLADARKVAALYPADPAVQAALSEAEYDAGNDTAAIAAADKAIAANPAEVNAYVQKGYALVRMAEGAKDEVAAWREARRPFVALNKLENDHPIPLIYFFRSYVAQGKPPPLAVQGLERAVELAPFDMALRFNLARQYLRDAKQPNARAMLAPIAYNPHGGGMAKAAQRLIEKIDDGTAGAADATEDAPDAE